MILAGTVAAVLAGGDRRSIGRSEEVVAAAVKSPELVGDIVEVLANADPVVRMRAADALEKIQRRCPDAVEPFRGRFLDLAAITTEQELRWHLAQILPRMTLTKHERTRCADIFEKYFLDKSAIVRVSALQAFVELAMQDQRFLSRAQRHLSAARCGSAAEKARARKLAPLLPS